MQKAYTLIQSDGGPEWGEDFATDGDPNKKAQEIIDGFNGSLRPGEKSRKLVRVEEKTGGELKLSHDWNKSNLVTLTKGGSVYDTYTCRRCGATGKRFGLSENVTLDKKQPQYCSLPEEKPASVEVLSLDDAERFIFLKKTVHNGILTCITVGHALREIKEKKLYVADGFETFEEFCDKEWGWTKRYCNQLILNADTVNGLPEAQRKLVTSHSAAKELAKIPEVLRPVVVMAATKGGTKTATGSSVRKAAPTSLPPRSKEKPASELPARSSKPSRKTPGPKPAAVADKLGFEVPSESLELWNRRMEAEELITYASAVVTRLRKIQDEGHPLFAEVDVQDAIACFTKGVQELERARPYALCPQCSGKAPTKECECKGRGFVSQFYWNTCVPEELRKIRTGAK